MKRYSLLFLFGILVLASILRLYKLDTVPPGINRDEASIGVTAYSLLTTGRDEYGRSMPLSFESFGDWKMPLYIYVTIPFVKVLGLSELAVRLPSAIAGIASVGAIYFLALTLFSSEFIALSAAIVLALMPWHIHISRVESEAIVATFALIVGSLMFLRAIKLRSLASLITSAAIFSSTFYTYHGNHVSTSLLILGLTGIYWHEIIKIPKWWYALITGTVLVGIILVIGFSADHTKLSGISIFGDPTVIHKQIELPRLEHSDPNSLVAKLAHNRITYAAITIYQNYLKAYGPEFLFIKGGGNSAHNILGFGNLHPIEAPLLLIGVIWLFYATKKKGATFVLWWIVIGGVAAAITKDAPHSNRTLAIVPSLAIAIAAGIDTLIRIKIPRVRLVIIAILLMGYATSMGIYLDKYFDHFPKKESQNWGYAYKKLAPILSHPSNAKKQIIMTHPETSPYIYLLFYTAYSPANYQKQAIRYPISRDGFTDVAGFGRYSFRPIDWEKDLNTPNTLLISKANETPSELMSKTIATITLPDGTPQYTVIDTDKK